MIAMPVKMNRDNPLLTRVFGKAKWFAFVDERRGVGIRENPYAGSGVKTVVWLMDEGVDRILTQHIGGNPFMILKEQGVRLFYPGEGRLTVDEALKKLRESEVEEITMDNVMRFTHH